MLVLCTVSIQLEDEWLERAKMSLSKASSRHDSKGGRLRDKNGKPRILKPEHFSVGTQTFYLLHARKHARTIAVAVRSGLYERRYQLSSPEAVP